MRPLGACGNGGANDERQSHRADRQTRATLVIYGADGTGLLSDRAGAMQWSGLLPKAQDYFIDVKPVTGAVSYTLQVTVRRDRATTAIAHEEKSCHPKD